MIEFLIQHQFWAAVAIYWIFSAAVSAMPEPATNGSPGYLWLYRFIHTIAGNITTAFAGRIPGLKILGLLLLMPLLLSTTACAGQYRVHPGALNVTDSAAYDTLLVAETVIDQARLDYQNQKLPPEAKDVLQTLITAYNVARESWLIYRGALANNVPPAESVRQLAQNLADLTNAIQAMREVN